MKVTSLKILLIFLIVFVLWLRGANSATTFRGPEISPLPCSEIPALTGDVTTPGSSCVTTDTWHKISTQTASGSTASLQWTGLGTAYNTYFLWCYGIYAVTNNASPLIEFGEGGTPTWETASYFWSSAYIPSTASPTVTPLSSGGTTSGIDTSVGGLHQTASQSLAFSATIYNIPSTSNYASVVFSGTQASGTSNQYTIWGSGNYTGDTTAKTAIRVNMSTGNMGAGTCSLWGIVPP